MAQLIRNGHVVTMNAARDVFDGGFVVVEDDGRIGAVGPADQCPVLPDAEVIDAAGMIVVPGLVDAQHHHWQNLLMAALPLAPAIDPVRLRAFACRHLDQEALATSARIAAHTLLRGGTTCALNHPPDSADETGVAAVIDAWRDAGLRQLQALEFRPAPAPGGRRAAAVRAEGERLASSVERWHGSDEGRIGIALEVATSVVATQRGQACEEATSAAHRLATQYALRLVTRTSAADGARPANYQAALQAHGRSEVMHLMELGALDARWLLVGGELLTATDVALMRESGCSAVYTPLGEAGRGLGWGPWTELRRAGVPCALGSGPLAQHGGADMVEQMKASVLVQNTVRLDAAAMSAEAALEMATIDAARALGLDDRIGSLEPGKRADIAVFDLRGVQMQVAHKPISVFVTCAGGVDAAWVMVDGRVLVREGRVAAASDAEAWVSAGRRHARTLRDAWAATAAVGS
jgi:5-methylthioadenosine/S-adenosylhomocysteine deaminase